jgi:hypothetical protein
MNFRRGFFRVWVAVCLCWAAYSLWHYSLKCTPLALDNGKPSEWMCPSIIGAHVPPGLTLIKSLTSLKMLGEMAAIILGPPIAALLVGAILGWALSGFATMRRSN